MGIGFLKIALIINIPYCLAQLMRNKKALIIFSVISGAFFIYLIFHGIFFNPHAAADKSFEVMKFTIVLSSFIVGIATRALIISFKKDEKHLKKEIITTIAGFFLVYVIILAVGALMRSINLN